ncbi:hypothetical protein [Telmatospirillum sp.]|uniref:hypothetical protein n=1 Tax=Telmatospirillum sp. TaxID=2079197 RepID=UPI002850BB4A|nr:hypothetical protein [Telmatospirillum sp.]MDR3435967.1 hypothetical protein [Telmatospirillum sp.]
MITFRESSIGRRPLVLGAATLLVAALISPVRSARGEEALTFDGLYKSFGVRGLEFSDRLLSLKDSIVSMKGYMAPPLKAESHFFVLTREPMALCPFCQSDAEWPLDIVVIYLDGTAPLVSAGDPITVHGRLQVGSWTDPETGFVSQVRIVDAAFRRS